MSIDISVIVPVYNVEKFINKCVESLLNQDFNSYEIILVDDGSPDNCPSICEDYSDKYENVVALHKSNGGLGDARNFGVAHSHGQYIVFVDSDDYVEREYLSNLWDLRNQFDADISVSKIKREFPDAGNVPHSSGKVYCLTGEEALFEVYKHEELGWSACGKLIKKEFLTEFPFPGGYYEDSAVMYKILDAASKVAVGDYIYTYHYLNHEGSILQSELNDKHFRIFEICDEFDKYIMENHSKYSMLSVLFKRAAITQMLNCQKMSWNDYKTISRKYRSIFRKHWFRILKDDRFSFSNKAYLTLYCTTPIFIKLVETAKKVRNC